MPLNYDGGSKPTGATGNDGGDTRLLMIDTKLHLTTKLSSSFFTAESNQIYVP